MRRLDPALVLDGEGTPGAQIGGRDAQNYALDGHVDAVHQLPPQLLALGAVRTLGTGDPEGGLSGIGVQIGPAEPDGREDILRCAAGVAMEQQPLAVESNAQRRAAILMRGTARRPAPLAGANHPVQAPEQELRVHRQASDALKRRA